MITLNHEELREAATVLRSRYSLRDIELAVMLETAAAKIYELESELEQLKKTEPSQPEPGIEVVETPIRFRCLKVYLQAVSDPRKSERLAQQFAERIDKLRKTQDGYLFGANLL